MLQIIDRAEQLSKRLPATAPRLNVLMFGFDSVSRLTWMRNLPRSYQYLVHQLGANSLQVFEYLYTYTVFKLGRVFKYLRMTLFEAVFKYFEGVFSILKLLNTHCSTVCMLAQLRNKCSLH